MFSRRHLLYLISVLIVIITLGMTWMISRDHYTIYITNNTDSVIKHLELGYVVNDSTIETIANLSPNETQTYHLDTTAISTEEVIQLYYRTESGLVQTKVIIGYLERGQRGDVSVSINAMNEEGQLDISVHEH